MKYLLRNVVFSALLFAATVPLSAQPQWNSQVDECSLVHGNRYDWCQCRLQMYMSRYPQSQLCDVYKFCFQDFWGLEHLLDDSAGAVRYIQYEMANSDTADWHQPLFFYPLLENNFVRVDINYVRKGIIPIETMVSAMLQSTVTDDGTRLEQWRKRWASIVQLLKSVEPQPLNYDEDFEKIEQLLDSGRYAMHHSPLFNSTYHQHYRIIRRDVFERMLLPLIENTTNQ